MNTYTIKELVAQGKSTREITFIMEQQAISTERTAESLAQSEAYYAKKLATGNYCKCGTLIAEDSKCCRYCLKTGKTPVKYKSVKGLYKTRTFYGLSNDLMDHAYLQGGSCSPR